MGDLMREQFEKWARYRGLCMVARGVDGFYVDESTGDAWEAWQSRQPEIDALIAERDALRKEAESWKNMYHSERKRIEGAPMGEIVSGRANSFGGYNVEIRHDVSFVMGDQVRLVAEDEA